MKKEKIGYGKLFILTAVVCVITFFAVDRFVYDPPAVNMIRLNHASDSDLIIAPYEAVLQDEKNSEYVYVVNGGYAQKRYIITGSEYADGFAVVSGLFNNEIIVMNPEELHGDEIRVEQREEK